MALDHGVLLLCGLSMAVVFGMVVWKRMLFRRGERLVVAMGGSIEKMRDGGTCWLKIDLANTIATDADLAFLAWFPGCSLLSLLGTRISDHSAECLRRLRRLEVLDLSSTGISDSMLSALVTVRGLRVLRLANTAVSDASMAALSQMKQLRLLDVMGTTMSKASIDGFVRDHPGISVFSDYGHAGLTGRGRWK